MSAGRWLQIARVARVRARHAREHREPRDECRFCVALRLDDLEVPADVLGEMEHWHGLSVDATKDPECVKV